MKRNTIFCSKTNRSSVWPLVGHSFQEPKKEEMGTVNLLLCVFVKLSLFESRRNA